MRKYWIWLANTPALTKREKAACLEKYQNPEKIYHVKKASLAENALSDAVKILEDCRRLGVHIVTLADTDYPYRLRHISDPPLVLYYRGTLPDFKNDPAVGVAGTRKASSYGLETARDLGCQLAKCGAVVVTGLASGIDAMAASGALEARGTVVGVLGCGVDVVYPKTNRELFRETEQSGCLISEYAPGTPPLHYHFPKRNRIISGLSDAVLVVEAPQISGALITARRAMEQGRGVFVVPGNIDQQGFVGSNQLLKEGASLAASGWDVLCEYQSQYPDKLHRAREVPDVFSKEKQAENGPRGRKIPMELFSCGEVFEKKPIDKNPSTAYSDVNAIAQTLSGSEKAIVLALASGPMLTEDLRAVQGVDAGRLTSSLTMLEIRGIVKRLPGKRISLK